jgi:hypothetical protein
MLFKFQFSDGPGKPTISVSFSDTEIGVARRHRNRCRFSAPKSVPFSDTEIGVARRYGNQCRVTGRLVLKMAHKSVSFYGTFGAEIESK